MENKQKIINIEFEISKRRDVRISPVTGEIKTVDDEGYNAVLSISRVGNINKDIVRFPYFSFNPKEAVDISIALLEKMKNDIDNGIKMLEATKR